MASRRTDSPMHARLMESAAHLLALEGPSGLSTRKVAAAAGTSTMTLYSHFGSMPELIKAVAEEGYARLADEFERAPRTDDPVADLGGIFAAYISHARASPDLYVVMFGSASLGGYRSTPDDLLRTGRYAYDYIVEAARRAMDAGRLDELAPVAIAAQIWTALHGYVVLELAGYYTPPDAGIRNVLRPMMLNLVIGLGDSRESALRSSGAWFPDDQASSNNGGHNHR
ncbi:TetR/AcrR family transcriptional regulator [Hoyosella sp. G463]|uniref:TetR/AcrR family transcriptional regulator n=1 Tax=Lolliginicoccus lacisalsi TaxID=2742202 RepID=A0A927JDV0_9ACTN|nr:TetR/AcrR family transcriptional regulator [Lolliginicoccus lacisalsi]MBD8507211.1 TetR/AcrR family transcriptional regulator [Lolliginicoccus lacisalsi]